MVQLTLPTDAKIGTGDTWPKPDGATKLKEFRVYARRHALEDFS